MTQSRSIPTAVVGYGFAGRCFHSYLVGLAAPALTLKGIVSSRPQARADITGRLGVYAWERFEDVLADDEIELIVLATPNDVHAPQAIAALQAGKHVVTDKPMSLNGAEADAMMAAARDAGRILTVFQNRRWDGDYLTVKQLLTDGQLGALVYAQLAWGQYGAPGSWRGQAHRGGGKFIDLGAHMIDQALQLVPAPLQRVYARFTDAGLSKEVEDHAHCVLSFGNGAEIHVVTSSIARAPMPRWYVLGTDGAFVKHGVDPQEGAMITGDIDAAREPDRDNWPRLRREVAGRSAETVFDAVPGRWRSFYENVAAAIRGQADLAVTPASVRRVMGVFDAARESAHSGRAVDIVPS
ncbi:MAG: Gfo/Idh/MocA family oxidoreductase [bacterium]|nr:Gfo/Idh/MocA family oxidoreductase [bacterium]